MRITRRQLRQVIKEEISRLSEQREPGRRRDVFVQGPTYFTGVEGDPMVGVYFAESALGNFLWNSELKQWEGGAGDEAKPCELAAGKAECMKLYPQEREMIYAEELRNLGLEPLGDQLPRQGGGLDQDLPLG